MDSTATSSAPKPAVDRCIDAFRSFWGEPDIVARAPGRVNLIGEHTDYNDGFALPMALPFDTVVALGEQPEGEGDANMVIVDSADFGRVEYNVEDDPRSVVSWALHIAGAAHMLAADGVTGGGWQATIETDIPHGASLSSSAALEVALTNALLARAGVAWSPLEVARFGQRIENDVVGLPSGIMDQFISAGAVAGHASLMDCRELTLTPTPLPAGVVVAVMDTGTRRVLADAAYAERRASCEQAVAALGVESLREATSEMVDQLDDELLRRRAGHVVSENARTIAATEAMAQGDLKRLTDLVNESHRSLRDDYEVSGPGLDAIVEVATTAPGSLGARMTGGGFAGCAVALVRADQAEAFSADVIERYGYDGHTARVWMCAPSAGAGIVDR